MKTEQAVSFSSNALGSVDAVLRGDMRRNPEFASAVHAAVPTGHHAPLNSGCLYTVTTISSGPAFGGTRTVAVCDDFARADEIVLTNEGDIFEFSYALVVVEELTANCLYGGGFDRPRYWYCWIGGAYRPIREPVEYAGVSGFGIG